MYRPSDDDHDLTHADDSFEALLNTAPRSFPIGLLVNKPLERLRSRDRGPGRGNGRARVGGRRSGAAATTRVPLAVDPFRAGDGDGDVDHEGEQDKDEKEEHDLDQAETTVLWAPGNTPWAKGPVERVFPEQEEEDGKLSKFYRFSPPELFILDFGFRSYYKLIILQCHSVLRRQGKRSSETSGREDLRRSSSGYPQP